MSSKATTPEMQVIQDAIADEARASLNRNRRKLGLSDSEIAIKMGVGQSWLSKRVNGLVPWSAAELKSFLDIIDEDITVVMAAGALAQQEYRKTNPCLSHSETVCSEGLGTWARRGYEMAVNIFPTRRLDIDGTPQAA